MSNQVHITGSPKTARKLPTNGGVVTGIGHHINPLHNPYPNRQNQPAQQSTGMPHYGGGAEKCARCSKNVYLAEKKVGAGRAFHSSCFNCQTCKRKVDATTLSEHKGEIYCKTCYTRQFGVHGLVSGVNMSTEHPQRESRPSRRSSYGSDLDAPQITHQQSRQRAHSNDNALRGELDAIQIDEPQRLFPWRNDVLPKDQSPPNKNSGIEAIVEHHQGRPTSQIGFEKIIPITVTTNATAAAAGNSHRSTYVEEDDRRNYTFEGERRSYGGASAFVDVPVVLPPVRSDRNNERFNMPMVPIKSEERSRSPSPLSMTDSYGRQSSRERHVDITDNFSRLTLAEDGNNSKYLPNNMTSAFASKNPLITSKYPPTSTTNVLASENPLVTDQYYRSSSYESKHLSSSSNSTTAMTTNLDRQPIHLRDSSPSATQTNNRSPSPTSGYVSSSTTRTSSSPHDALRDSTSPVAYVPHHDYYNTQTSTSSHSDAIDRRPSASSQKTERTPSAMGSFVSHTHDLASNMSPNVGDKYSALGALVKPFRPLAQQNNGSDDDFEN